MDNHQNEFLLTRADDIRAALFELTHPDTHIIVRDAADHEMAAVILGIDRQTSYFFWRLRDYAATVYAHGASLRLTGTVFHFVATGYGGVRIHFRIPCPESISFEDGSTALFSPIPERISRVQRRKMFRASLVQSPVVCLASWTTAATSAHIVCSVRDISIEGIGLRSSQPLSALPRRGDILHNVKLQFGDLGTKIVDLSVCNTYALNGNLIDQGIAAHDPDTPALVSTDQPDAQPYESHIGASIVSLNARDEVWLQQMVWRLEKMRTTRPTDIAHAIGGTAPLDSQE
jgi:c-di-GMP-binding flagellar brake protein YcgR